MTPIENHEFLRSAAKIEPMTAIILGGIGRVGKIIGIAGGTDFEGADFVRYWTVAMFMDDGEKLLLGVLSIPGEYHKIEEIGRLQAKADPLIKDFIKALQSKTSQ